MADQSRKQSLSNELRDARAQVGSFVAVVREDLNVGARLKSNYSRHPGTWFGAAAGLGLLLSRILIPPRKVAVSPPAGWNFPAQKTSKLGVVLTALKFAFTIVQPSVAGLVTKLIESRLSSRDSKR